MGSLDDRVAELAARHHDLAVALLREAIRIPADVVDLPPDQGGDPRCGTSNHEGPRLTFLRDAIVDVGAVQHADDVGFDEYGNLVWEICDGLDGVEPDHRRLVVFDGHTDTVAALRPQWHERFGGALDPYLGAVDLDALDRAVLRDQLGWLPPDEEWDNLLFGRGSADQLAGVISQIVASKILLELVEEGSLAGVVVRSIGTVAEEDHDGGGPAHWLRGVVADGGPAGRLPHVVVLTEGTGDAVKGALGIYRGQRGRCQIEMVVRGRSSHGSMPWEGLNPFEHAGAIVAEAARAHAEGVGFADHAFLGKGTRTASWTQLETPSDCAVPERMVVRFDRRLTVGESAARAVADVEALPAVAAARAAGLTVDIRIPRYRATTWVGHPVDDPQDYPGWLTPEDHPAVLAAVDAYRGVVSPLVEEPPGGATGGSLRREPRVDRWIFSTDGVGYPVRAEVAAPVVPGRKRWVRTGDLAHPAMIGIGAGLEQHTHKLGECVDTRHLRHAVAVLARFPSAFVARS
jgi:acetylornithine deacetylase/succinyl-diaminopimelate desuccinylase-like protein